MPAPLRIPLSPADVRHLRFLERRAPSTKVGLRAVAILMMAQGRSCSEVASALGFSPNTLTRLKQRFGQFGAAGLEDRPRPGRPPKADASYLGRLLRTVRQDPRRLGYAFTRWTAPRLGEHLFVRTGVRLCPAWVTELLSRRGIVWRRTRRTIRNLPDPRDLARARRALEDLKKGRPREHPTKSGLATGSASTFFPP